MANNVLKDKNGIILNPKIPRYENLKIYSTDEKMIGMWINGKKLYRKVVNFDYFGNNGQRTVSHNITNLDDIVFYQYSWYDITDETFFSGMRFDNSTTYCKVSVSNTSINAIGKGTDWASRTTKGKCILYYTKTV